MCYVLSTATGRSLARRLGTEAYMHLSEHTDILHFELLQYFLSYFFPLTLYVS